LNTIAAIMSDDLGLHFFAELGSLALEAIKESGLFSAGHAILVGIKNNTTKPMKMAYCETPDSRWEHRPADLVKPGESTYGLVKPTEGWLDLDYHMECDLYYNKADADQALCRIHITYNMFSKNDWNDTKAWNDCKLDTRIEYPAFLNSMIWAQITVNDLW
jgi:hypothetical protein